MTPMPHPPSSVDPTLSNVFVVVVSPIKTVLEENCCRRSKKEQEMAEALKGIKIDELKNCFEQWEKMS